MKHAGKRLLSFVLSLAMVAGLFPATVLAASAAGGDAQVYDLRIEDLTAPVGLDETNPAFSWKMKSDAIGAKQTAYSITVTSESGEEVWNTGWVESDQSTYVTYDGTALTSSTEYTVEVAIKDENGKETTPISSTFEMGLLEEDAFADAQWISYQKSSPVISDATTYTIDFDFVIDIASQGFCFGMENTDTFVMWQVNAYKNKDTSGEILLRPHFKKNNSWTAYPGGPGNVKAVELNDVLGYDTTTIIGQTIHERIEVNGKTIKTYFGSDAEHLTLADTYTHTAEIPLNNVGFRHYSNAADGTEVARYDNLVITDENGEVIFSEDFEDGLPTMETTASYYSVEDGQLKLGTTSLINEQVYMICNSSSNVLNGDSLPAYRKSITVGKNLKSAKLYTSGLGVYESFINGERVGRKMDDGSVVYDELKPGFTLASTRMFYNSYDVTWMLEAGQENVLSSVVSTGWWNSGWNQMKQGSENAYLAKLILTYNDGSQEVIVTDNSWKTAKAARQLKDTGIYNGERYDARVDESWMLPGYDDSAWGACKINSEFKGELTAWDGETVTVREDLERTPVEMYIYEGATGASSNAYGTVNKVALYTDGDEITLKPGQTLHVNFGQNFAGWESFTVTAEAGTTVNVEHGEWRNDGNGETSRGNDGPEGSIYKANYRAASSNTRYITVEGEQTYHPSHTFYGFQYAEFTADKEVTLKNIRGQVVTSVHEDTASMTTSNEDINKLISNIRWGMYSNYLSIATDCPQRDERQGWTADTQVFSETGMFLGHNKSFLEKMMQDIADSQIKDTNSAKYGAYTEIAPKTTNYFADGDGGTGWADAGIVIPYNLYVMYGDVNVIYKFWDSMELYMDYLSKQEYGPTLQFGDWLHYEPETTTSKQILSVAYYAWDAQMMVEMAQAIGDEEAAAKYQAVYEGRKAFFAKKFVKEDGSLVQQGQAVALHALYMDLLPNDESVAKVTEQLISNIESNGNKLQTGFLGTAIIMNTLVKIGRVDVAYKLLLQHDNPSWLYSVDQGATTTWERWNSYTLASGFGSVSMNSFNHYAYGAVSGWMYSDMAGIDHDVKNPGYKHIILDPNPDQSISTVEASYDSNYGTIVSNMRYEGNSWNYECTVPANTTATILLPVEQIDTLKVNGKAVSALTAADGLTYEGYADGIATFEAVAGSFSFVSEIAVKNYLTIEVDAPADMPPVSAEVTIGEETTNTILPTTLTVKEGDTVSVRATCLNPADYKVTGWTSDGQPLAKGDTLNYTVRGDMTVTVKAEHVDAVNLAQGKSVTAPQINASWQAANLTDGVLYQGNNNGWSSPQQKGQTFNAVTAVIDLGEAEEFNHFRLYPRNDLYPTVANLPVAYTIYVSDDNSTWTPVYTTQNGEVTNGYAPVCIQLEEAVSGRYVKLEVTKLNAPDEHNNYYVQLAEFGVYLMQEETTDVALTVSGEKEANINDETVRFTVSASNMNKMANAIIEMTISEETLAEPVVTAAEGWLLISQVYQDGVVTAVLGNLEGGNGSGELLTLTCKPTGETGTATVKITEACLTVYTDETEDYVNADLTAAEAATALNFNRYDVNHDGVVDLLDITRAQRFYGTKDSTCDVNHDGEVDINDLILILNNCTEAF